MIVRILGEGQWDVDASHLDALNELDDAVEKAVETEDEAAFDPSLRALLAAVREWGSLLSDDELVESNLILPPADASAHEVKEFLGDEGLIPDTV
ncbi:hypothetical protein BH24ACT12_BH24ACT12_10620 [soil metagenome]|jgi:hypothetical protein